MKIQKKNLLCIPFVILVYQLKAQELTHKKYSKIEVEAGKKITVIVDSLQIDTLILKDRSVILFKNNTTLLIENAYIGKGCIFDASGKNGQDGEKHSLGLEINGENGKDGKNLRLTIAFKSLGSLLISTTGGKGGNGGSGKAGVSGENIMGADGESGQNGGNGGNGGSGGNIELYYLCENFTPTINGYSNSRHNIQLRYSGGKEGLGGQGGPGGIGGRPETFVTYTPEGKRVLDVRGKTYGRNGTNGQRGHMGNKGKDGDLIILRIDN